MTTLDVLLQPQLVSDAWDYFRNVQTKDQKYTSFLSRDDAPATYVNARPMLEYRERQRPFYYDPARYPTYLDQLGIAYPTIRREPSGVR